MEPLARVPEALELIPSSAGGGSRSQGLLCATHTPTLTFSSSGVKLPRVAPSKAGGMREGQTEAPPGVSILFHVKQLKGLLLYFYIIE